MKSVLLLIGLVLVPAGLQAAERPNIVMIAIDDLNDWVGCLKGHPQAKTPHIDALAAQGTLFSNAHCQAPLCNPSRTSVLTGKRPSTSGVYALEPWLRKAPALENAVTLPEYFRQQGYRVMIAGKIFHGGTPPQNEKSQYADVWGPAGGVGVRPKEKLVPHVQGGHPLVDWGTFPHSDEEKGDWKVASWGVEQLQSTQQTPFFLSVGFFLPHVPCYASQRWFDLHPQTTLVLPTVLDSDRDDIPDFAWNLHWKLPEPRLSWMKESNQWAHLVQSYLACTSFVDSQVGRIVEAVRQRPDADNTLIVLWSDHGWHLGEKGVTGKNTLWHESTRVPLLFAGPGIARGVSEEPAELLDLYPTLADLCGLPVPKELEGHSLRPQLESGDTPREWPAITTQSPGNHSIVTRDWRYIRYADGSEELYHIRQDPNEWKNLAAEPSLSARKAELRRWLPAVNASPAPGSRSRLLEQRDGVWYWEGTPIKPEERIE